MNPEMRPKQGSLWLRVLPYFILLCGGAVLAFKWNSIPERWPVHWGFSGQPDRWSTKNPVEVFLPIGAGLLICCFLEAIAFAVRMSAIRRSSLSLDTATAVAALTSDLVRMLEIAIAIVFVSIGVKLPFSQSVSATPLVAFILVVVGVAIGFGMIRLNRGVRDLKRAGHAGLEGYNGVSYRNADDPRLWVPKISGLGYTLNFAHPWAWPILIIMLAIPLLFVLTVVLMAR